VKKQGFDDKFWPSVLPSAGILIFLWLIQWAQHLFVFPFYKLGVLPQSLAGLKGIVFMPLIHDKQDIHHLLNNSIAFALLLSLLMYSYRKVFLKVFLISWLSTGLILWAFANNHGAYHIGISGLIYALFSFLFISGLIRRYFPLQALSLLVVFLYGSLIWGIFPLDQHISWEGHLAGFISGFFLAVWYRKEGPVRPKYQYEIERELGIEPPDFEGELIQKMRDLESKNDPLIIHYHFTPNSDIKPKDDNTQSIEPSPDPGPQDPHP
jgi:membrane associated rhomboid family serine protease